jgi:hypothetical protein
LEWGLRIVAAYDDGHIMLYNVPRDVFDELQGSRRTSEVWNEYPNVVAQSDVPMDAILTGNPPSSSFFQAYVSAGGQNSPKALQIDGAVLFHIEDDVVEDFAINSDFSGFSLWLFWRSGSARLYDIYMPHDHVLRERYVGHNGLVYNLVEPSEPLDQPSSKNEEEMPKGKQHTMHIKWA